MEVRIDRAGFHYVYEGPRSGRSIVFVHGFPLSLETWRPQLRALRNEFRVLAYDLRGHGKSFSHQDLYTIEEHVDDLFSICSALDIQDPVLVGLSMGGYIALRAVERNQRFFSGLVLCDTKSESDSDEKKILRATTMKDIRENGMHGFVEGFMKTAVSEHTSKKNSNLVDQVRSIVEGTPEKSVMAHLLALAARTDMTKSLENLKIPTAILVGEFDEVTPVRDSELMHNRIKNSSLHLIEDSGHLSNLENPEVFNQYLIDFLRTIPNR